MKMVFIVVVLLLIEPIFLIVLVLLLQITLCRVAPGYGVSRRPGANLRCCDLEVAPLGLGVCPCGPLVCESDRLHTKLECAGETDLPHLVSENFSKSGKLLETRRPLRCAPPVRTAGRGKVFRA